MGIVAGESKSSSKNRGQVYLWLAASFLFVSGLLHDMSGTGLPSVSSFSDDYCGVLEVSGVVEGIGRTHGGSQAVYMKVVSVSGGRKSAVRNGYSENTVLYMGDMEVPALPGDTIAAEAVCRRVENFAGGFDYVRYMGKKGIRYTCFRRGDVEVFPCGECPFRVKVRRWRSAVIAALRRYLSPLDDENSALLTAFLTGDRESLKEDILGDFRRSGMMHALALSGMHVGFIYSFLSFLLSVTGGFPASKKVRSVVVMCCLWPYALLTGMGTSIFRAVVMATVYEMAVVLERERNSSGALALSAVIVILADPSAPASLSFQLSFGAMLGIVVCYRRLSAFVRTEALHVEVAGVMDVLRDGALAVRRGISGTDWVGMPSRQYARTCRRRAVRGRVRMRVREFGRRYVVKPVWNLFALSFSCQLVTAPVILMTFGTYARWSLLANIICSPLIGLSMMMAPVCMVLGGASPVGSFCFGVLDFLLDALRFSVEVMGRD